MNLPHLGRSRTGSDSQPVRDTAAGLRAIRALGGLMRDPHALAFLSTLGYTLTMLLLVLVALLVLVLGGSPA